MNDDDDDDDDNLYTYYMLQSLYIYIIVHLCIYIEFLRFFGFRFDNHLALLFHSSVSISLLNIIDIRKSKQQFNKALSYSLELLHPNPSYRQASS